MQIYHVETQEDYGALMVELEGKGYLWLGGKKPTSRVELWHKNKEDLVWFEDRSYTYLNFDKFNEKVMITNATGLKNFTVLFTETEARDILKDDFDKFEKVECE